MKVYQNSLGEKGQSLNGAVELLEHTSKLVDIFRDMRPIKSLDDSRINNLLSVMDPTTMNTSVEIMFLMTLSYFGMFLMTDTISMGSCLPSSIPENLCNLMALNLASYTLLAIPVLQFSCTFLPSFVKLSWFSDCVYLWLSLELVLVLHSASCYPHNVKLYLSKVLEFRS